MSEISKSELVALLSEKTDIDTPNVEKLLSTLSDVITGNSGRGVLVPSLGEFRAIQGENRQLTHPATGEQISVPGPVELRFSPDSAVNGRAVNSFHQTNWQPPEIDDPEPLEPLRLLAFEQRHLDRGDYNVRGKDCNHKIGGEPDWIHGEQTPHCCKKKMQFYGQLDSKLGDEYNVSDAAMIYVFVCRSCGATEALQQSY